MSIGSVRRRERQLNVYYDAHWRLANSASTLRIRISADAYPVLTLKVPVALRGDQRVMREFEIPAGDLKFDHVASFHPTKIDVVRTLPGEPREYLARLGVRYLQRVGWMRNTRLTVDVHGIGAFELDRIELPDCTVAHEAEIETADPLVQHQLTALVCRVAFDARPSRLSKFERFRLAAIRREFADRNQPQCPVD